MLQQSDQGPEELGPGRGGGVQPQVLSPGLRGAQGEECGQCGQAGE